MIRLLKGKSKRAPKMIGFVHNSDTDPVRLLDMTRELLKLVSPEAGRRASKVVGDRWFVLKGAAGRAWLEAYRYLYSQLGMPTDYAKILMVFGDGQVEALAG